MSAPRRILVYGVTGSGKSTLAAEASRRSGIPYIAVDDLTWKPGWVSVHPDEQREIFAEVCARDEWILDSAYSAWIDLVEPRVELVVALDYPRWLSFGRLFRRTLARLFDGRPVCNGNRETIKNFFSRDAILVWHFRSFHRKRAHIRRMRESGLPVLVCRRPADAQAWLDSLGSP